MELVAPEPDSPITKSPAQSGAFFITQPYIPSEWLQTQGRLYGPEYQSA